MNRNPRHPRFPILGLILIGLILPVGARGGDEKAKEKEKVDPLPEQLHASQVSLIRDRRGKRVQFRATVVAKTDGSVTFLTAGHCLGAADVGGQILVRRGEESIDATIESVHSNPYYRPALSGDIPGADNAVFRVKLDTSSEFAKKLWPVEVASAPIFDAGGRILAVGMIDQFSKSHVVKAGNYSNPRWLEWGPSYSPVPGDSGSGVFVLRLGSDKKPVPVLVGVVVDRSERGGGASLTSLKDRWLSTALAPAEAKK